MNPWLNRATWLAAWAALLLASCSKSDNASHAGEPAKPRTVRLAPVAARPMERTVTAVGALNAQEQATLSVKVPGRLQRLTVDLGSVVRKGDVLAQVEPKDYELRVQQSAAALAQARALLGLSLDGTNDVVEFEKTSVVKQAAALLDEAMKNRDRILSLIKAQISAPSELDTAEALYRVAQNRYEGALEEARTRQATLAQRRVELELAQKQLADTSLRAPFDGAIQARPAGLGEYLGAGTPVVMLVRTDPLRLRLEVPEREAPAVRVGQLVRVHVEGDTNACTGRLARLSPAITDTSRMLIVEADIPNDGSLRPGAFVRADIITNERDTGLAVPLNALLTFAGLEKVVVIRDGKALEKTVTTGRRGEDWVEISAGLAPGESVVVAPGNLRTGQPVTITGPGPLTTNRPATASGW